MFFKYALVALLSATAMVAAMPNLEQHQLHGGHKDDKDDKKCYTKTKLITNVVNKPFTTTITEIKTFPVTNVHPSVTEVVKTVHVPYVTHVVTLITKVITSNIDVTKTRAAVVTDKKTVQITKTTVVEKPVVTASVGVKTVTNVKQKIVTKCPKKYGNDKYHADDGAVYDH